MYGLDARAQARAHNQPGHRPRRRAAPGPLARRRRGMHPLKPWSSRLRQAPSVAMRLVDPLCPAVRAQCSPVRLVLAREHSSAARASGGFAAAGAVVARLHRHQIHPVPPPGPGFPAVRRRLTTDEASNTPTGIRRRSGARSGGIACDRRLARCRRGGRRSAGRARGGR